MSKILAKAFDASKKIIRSVFLGSPNIFTSSDLNRQIEAIKYQLDQLDEKLGFLSDISFDCSLTDGSLKVTYTYSYLEFKGCSFSPSIVPLSINFTASAPTVYVCLAANVTSVTYDDDASHEISGAKFENGTSMPAANQLVYRDETIVLTHSLSSISNLVGVLAVINKSSTGTLILKPNVVSKESSALLSAGGGVITDFNANVRGAVTNGTPYDEAFSKLQYQLNRGVRVYPLRYYHQDESPWYEAFESDIPLQDIASEGDIVQIFIPIKIRMSGSPLTQLNVCFPVGKVGNSDFFKFEGAFPILVGQKIELEYSNAYEVVGPMKYIVQTTDGGVSGRLQVLITEGLLNIPYTAHFIVYRRDVGV